MMLSRGVTVQPTQRHCLLAGCAVGRARISHVLLRTRQHAHIRLQRSFAASVEAVAEEEQAVEVAAAQPDADLAETSAADDQAPAAPEAQGTALFSLNFLWLEKNIAVAVDQVISESQRSPLTEYFFWPRKDAWEELKSCLESKPWVSERDKVLLLNRTTEVINFWQDEEQKHSISEAQERFPDCKFLGS